MSTGQDAIRNQEINNSGVKESVDRYNQLQEISSAAKRTALRNNTRDPNLVETLNEIAAAGKKRGIDNLPSNLDGNRFPLGLKSASLDGFSDWKSQYKDLSYPGIESKSGYTKGPVYTDDISKKNFNPSNLKSESQPVIERIKKRKQTYNLFEDYPGKQFTHLLDYFNDQKGGLGDMKQIPADGNTKDIYLGSFIKTTDDNEDPTMLGYDFIIKWNTSPLFNGEIENFIVQFSDLGNSEIGSRLSILNRFKQQFNKFIKNDSKETSGSPNFNGGDGAKAYYLKKIGGLNRLNDQTEDITSPKQFIEYGKDFITLEFNEDVTQNIGYLASLYKALSYSRVNGKQIIPENLLRFDVDIEITEIRKYKRVFKNKTNNSLDFYADKISKYVYSLYECQFYFPDLPHGESLDMSSPTTVDSYNVKFNYKWSTLKFNKFTYDTTQTGSSYSTPTIVENSIDNSEINPFGVKVNSTNNNFILNGGISSFAPTSDPKIVGGVETSEGGKDKEVPSGREGSLEDTKNADSTNGNSFQSGDEEGSGLSPTEEPKGTPGTIKDTISKSMVQTTLDSKTVSNNKERDKVKNSLDIMNSNAINPSFKRFSQDILGGEQLKRNVTNIFIKEANKFIVSKAALLNKTLANISNGKFGANRTVRDPNNVYSEYYQRDLVNSQFTRELGQVGNDVGRRVANFVGRSVKNFFDRP